MKNSDIINGHTKIITFTINITNEGRQFAKAPQIVIEINEPFRFSEFGLDGNGNVGLFQTRATPSTPQKCTYMGGQNTIIYPDSGYDIDKIEIETKTDNQKIPELVLKFVIHAENSERVRRTKKIKIDD